MRLLDVHAVRCARLPRQADDKAEEAAHNFRRPQTGLNARDRRRLPVIPVVGVQEKVSAARVGSCQMVFIKVLCPYVFLELSS